MAPFYAVLFAAALTQPTAPPGENIALGRPYTLSPAPNYQHCTEPGDAVQLTDGEYSEGYFWTQATTVGWTSANPALVTIDLGSVQPIAGLSFNTAAGVAGVTWPTQIVVLVSDDRDAWYDAGEVVELSRVNGEPPAEGYAVHRYWTDQLHTFGRYVAVATGTRGAFIFCDEIEVYRGPDTLLSEARPAAPSGDLSQLYRLRFAVGEYRRAIAADAEATAAAIAADPQLPAGLTAELRAALAEAVERNTPDLELPDRPTWPLSPAHADILAVRGRLWQAQSRPPVAVWQTDRWAKLAVEDQPPGTGGLTPRLDFVLAGGEVRAQTLNLTNNTPEPIEVRLGLDGLADGPRPAWLTVREAYWSLTRNHGPTASALPDAATAPGGWRITLPPGMTRQLWLSVDSRGLDTGTRAGTLALSAGRQRLATVPLSVRVSPVRLPAEPTLGLGGWDYSNTAAFDVRPDNRPGLIKFLQEYQIDSPWATTAVLPPGTYDADGVMTAPPDTAALRAWLTEWPTAKRYYVFSNNAPGFTDTLAARRQVGAWIDFWIAELARWHITPDQLVLLVLDEPHNEQQERDTATFAAALHAAQPDVRILCDPLHPDPAAMSAEMVAQIDVWCPQRRIWLGNREAYEAFYPAQGAAGRELTYYSCSGPVRALDPYSYHLLQAWDCWRWGMTAEFFWAFSDAGGGTSWDEPGARGSSYAPQYIGSTDHTTAKQMEAVREGRQDYEYLHLLAQRVAVAEAAGRQDAALAAARELLESAPARVLARADAQGHAWDQVRDRTVSEQVRLELLAALETLR